MKFIMISKQLILQYLRVFLVIFNLELRIQVRMARFQLETYIKCFTISLAILHASFVQGQNKINVQHVTLEHQLIMFVLLVHQIYTMLKMLDVDRYAMIFNHYVLMDFAILVRVYM